jgi:hypothetical protein
MFQASEISRPPVYLTVAEKELLRKERKLTEGTKRAQMQSPSSKMRKRPWRLPTHAPRPKVRTERHYTKPENVVGTVQGNTDITKKGSSAQQRTWYGVFRLELLKVALERHTSSDNLSPIQLPV